MGKVKEKEQSLAALWGLVILKLDEPDEKYAVDSVVEIPQPARDMKSTGTVMDAGPGRIDIYGIVHPTELNPGDRVVFGRFLGINVWVNGEQYYQIPEKYILAKIDCEPEPELEWNESHTGKPAEYINVAGALASYVAKLSKEGWRYAAFDSNKELVWLRRDVYEHAPKIIELESQLVVVSMPKNLNEAIAEIVETTKPGVDNQALIKALAEWDSDRESEWKDDVDLKIESSFVIKEDEPGETKTPEYEYLNHKIRAFWYEIPSAEWDELTRLKKDGWIPDEATDNGQLYEVTKFRRILKREGLYS